MVSSHCCTGQHSWPNRVGALLAVFCTPHWHLQQRPTAARHVGAVADKPLHRWQLRQAPVWCAAAAPPGSTQVQTGRLPSGGKAALYTTLAPAAAANEGPTCCCRCIAQAGSRQAAGRQQAGTTVWRPRQRRAGRRQPTLVAFRVRVGHETVADHWSQAARLAWEVEQGRVACGEGVAFTGQEGLGQRQARHAGSGGAEGGVWLQHSSMLSCCAALCRAVPRCATLCLTSSQVSLLVFLVAC